MKAIYPQLLTRALGAILFITCALHAGAQSTTLDNSIPVRGFCVAAPKASNVDAFVKFIKEELAARGVNTLILRVDWNYQYEKHPELRDSIALSKADVKKIVNVCKASNIRLIPQINLLGHQSWAQTVYALLRVYPQFDEPAAAQPARRGLAAPHLGWRPGARTRPLPQRQATQEAGHAGAAPTTPSPRPGPSGRRPGNPSSALPTVRTTTLSTRTRKTGPWAS
ncbi:MAG: hypothetical protein QM762_20195 [Chryseolinea sp.]